MEGAEKRRKLLAFHEIGKGTSADGTTEAKLSLVMLRKRGGFNKEMYYCVVGRA